MTKDSDIDLLIVAPTPENRHEERLRIADAIGDIEYPVDVIIIASERFEATKDIIGGIAYPAHKYGRVLYRGRLTKRSAGWLPNGSKKADLDFSTTVRLSAEPEFGTSSSSTPSRPSRST